METLEQIQARHAAELATAAERLALAAELPREPQSMMDARACWRVTYETPNPAAVADIVRAFAPLIVPTLEWRNGCLYRQPLELYPEAQREHANRRGREVVFSLDTHEGRGFGPSVKFYFYARLASGYIVKVLCDLPDSWCAGARLIAPKFDFHGSPIGDGKAAPNLILQSIFHDHIAWTPNTRGLDARYTYTLCDDGPKYLETLEILSNPKLAAMWPERG